MAKSKMICPKCGNEMNHHADKLIYSNEGREAANFDPSLGGLIEETHDCPGCGADRFAHCRVSSRSASYLPTG